MDEGRGYCGSGGGIKSVSDAAKIANMVMTDAGEGWNLCGERQCRVKYETEIFGRHDKRYGFAGKERELTILEICWGRPIRRNSVLEGLRVR